MQPLLNIAVRAARRAGEVIVRSMNSLESLTIASKGRNDFVTEVDRAAEQEIIGTIRRHYPQHAFLAEESGMQTGNDAEHRWLIDPLDGTTNFLHGLPPFAMTLLTEALILGLFAMSLDLMFGYTRLVSFGHAAAYGLGAYACGCMLLHTDMPLLFVVFGAALLTGVVAIGVGWICTPEASTASRKGLRPSSGRSRTA